MASPDFRENPHRNLKTLRQEIVPWAPFADRGNPNQIIENQDDVLTYLARQDERAYIRMERSEPIVHHAMLRRKRTLLSAGWKIEPASNTPAARILTDFANEQLKRLRARWSTVLNSMHDAIFWGWRPLERTWDFSDTFKGKPAWYVRAVREKEPHEFRFTANRDLVWLGNGAGGGNQMIFHNEDEAARLRWLICSAGSSDKPYGIAELRYVWMIHYIKSEFMKLWAQGVARSQGVTKITQTGAGNLGSLAARESAGSVGAPGQAKTVDEVALEFRSILKVLQDSNILVERLGWKVEFNGDVDYAEGWRHPLEYCDKMMALMLTGDAISVTAGSIGSRGAVETKGEELKQFCVADGHEISGWLDEQLIGDPIRVNFPDPDPDDMPSFVFRLGHPVSLDACKWLFLAGATVDAKEIAREFGVPLIVDAQPGDVPLKKPEQVLGADGRPVPPGSVPPKPGTKPGPPQDPKPTDKAPEPDKKQAPPK